MSLLLPVFLLARRNQSSDEPGCVSILAISLKIRMISSRGEVTAACTAPALLPGHFLPGCGTGAGRSDEVPVPRARQDTRDQTGDLAAQTQISDQGPSVRGLDFCALDLFKGTLVGLGAISGC